MATATQTPTDTTTTTTTLPTNLEQQQTNTATDGALVHQGHGQDMVATSPSRRSTTTGTELVAHRPVSGAFSVNAEGGAYPEDRPGQKKNAQFLPWYTRWGYSISLGAAQGFLRPASLIRDTQDAIRSPVHQPNMIRSYECRKLLPVRVFFPKPFDKSKPRKLPVLFTIHGGHFIMGSPQDNDHFNAKFATKYASVVIALNYNKAPKNPFPGPIHDVEALLLAALADPELAPYVDRARVSVLGWSAGANLALTVTQLPAVRRIVSSVVAYYPPCDFTVSHHEKSRLRRYKPALGGFRAKETDYMLPMAPMVDWSYVPQGTELRNPLLSPYFADHELLPHRLFVIGAELDMFAHESWRLISKMAGRDVPSFETPVGREAPFDMGEVNLTDDKFHFETNYNDGSSYKWLLVPDTIHNFDQRIGGVIRDTDFRADAEIKSDACMKEIGNWLLRQSAWLGPESDGPTVSSAPPQIEG